MFLSVFDIFKLGIGPSSSHTMGPMTAAVRFLDALRDGAKRVPGAGAPARLGASLHGSLAFTGHGHGTDRAVILGFLGLRPDTLDPDDAERLEAEVRRRGRVAPPDLRRTRLRSGDRSGLRLRAIASRPCERPHAQGLRRHREPVSTGNLLFDRRWFRRHRAELAASRGRAEGRGWSVVAVPVPHRRGNARHGLPLEPKHRRDEACQRKRRSPVAPNWTSASIGSGGR